MKDSLDRELMEVRPILNRHLYIYMHLWFFLRLPGEEFENGSNLASGVLVSRFDPVLNVQRQEGSTVRSNLIHKWPKAVEGSQ